jgi:eukaryotic-like serine/threonine-protein kinase
VLKPGTRVGPFEVLASLGAGGMGEVYRARDPRLEREVALKVLPARTLTDETARARLLREARMAARLSHPNVCTIHEVGEAEGQAYIAMELVAGEPLSERLAAGRMAMEEVVRLGHQIADALAHAHEHAVVHRDLKAANVIVTPEGRAKVLDFGLAKPLLDKDLAAATTLTQASLTEAGAIVGTLAYMAPEQLRGRPADARSDVWALGVVMYEMASGRRPFAGDTGFELSSAILNQAPKALPAGVPPPLAVIIERCLVKEPFLRYQRGGEVRSALEALLSGSAPAAWPGWRAALATHRWPVALAVLSVVLAISVGLDVGGVRSRVLGGGAAGPAIRMAVLPFANLSGDPEQDYLSDGLTQEMITQLGRLHPEGLSVIARTSVMRYKKGDTPIDQIGRELKVEYVLEGSARREANRLRITTELIHVEDQTQLWADTYERELSGLLELQSEVAQRVATALALKLLPAEQARLTSVRAVDPEAHDAWLKGTYHWQKLTPADFDTAQHYFELALAKAPAYAPAYQGLASVWAARQQMAITAPREAGPKAKAAALKAIEVDERSAEAHEALAFVMSWTDWDWAGAEREWQRALELNPNDANTHAYYAQFLANVGRTDEALPHAGRALELDPFNALYQGMYATVLLYQRRYDEALAAARTALAVQPESRLALGTLQCVYIVKGMREEQLADQRRRIANDPGRVAAFEQGLAEGGYEGAQRRIADLLAARYEKAGGVPDAGTSRVYLPVGIALRYLDAGEYGRALDWLEEAYQVHDPSLANIGKPNWDPIRSDPRFQDLLRRIGIPSG